MIYGHAVERELSILLLARAQSGAAASENAAVAASAGKRGSELIVIESEDDAHLDSSNCCAEVKTAKNYQTPSNATAC